MSIELSVDVMSMAVERIEVDEEYKEFARFFDRCGLEIQRLEQDSNNERLYVVRKKER